MATPLQNIRLVIEYDGTAYVGWQRQISLASIQGRIETALYHITGESAGSLRLTAAGRTDAGVHALAQVANFKTHQTLAPRRFASALNSWLPNDICVHRAEGVPLAFDARHWAQAKRYRYRIYVGPHALALGRNTAWHLRRTLNVPLMRAAATHLLGELDFETFRSAHCDAQHAVRQMYSITITEQQRPPAGLFVDIVLHADAFCRHMCRIIAGTLVAVGAGHRPPQWVAQIQAQRLRQAAGMTAPPWGLTLLEVRYDNVFAGGHAETPLR